MKIIEGENSAKYSTYQLLSQNQHYIPKTTSVLKIPALEGEDHHSEVKCIATNTNLTKPPEKSFRINLLSKFIFFILIDMCNQIQIGKKL